MSKESTTGSTPESVLWGDESIVVLEVADPRQIERQKPFDDRRTPGVLADVTATPKFDRSPIIEIETDVEHHRRLGTSPYPRRSRLNVDIIWKISLVGDLIIWAVGLGVYLACVLGADDVNNRLSSLVTSIVLFATSILIYKFRQEPEISGNNRIFLIQIAVCTWAWMAERIIWEVCTYLQSPILYSPHWFVWIASISTWTYFGFVSAFILRMRLIHSFCAYSDFDSSYWPGLLLHIPVLVAACIPFYVCVYGGVTCTLHQLSSGIYALWVAFFLQALYYVISSRPKPGLFVDYGPNIRMLAFFIVNFVFMTIYAVVYGAPVAVDDIFLVSFTLIPIAWFELFGLALVKVVGRKLNKPLLKHVELQGVAHRVLIQDQAMGIAFLLRNDYAYEKLLAISDRYCFKENVVFLRSYMDVSDLSQDEQRGKAIRLLIEKHIIDRDGICNLNIGGESRATIESEYVVLCKTGCASKALLQELNAVKERLSTMLREHVVRVLNHEEVISYCQTIYHMIDSRAIRFNSFEC